MSASPMSRAEFLLRKARTQVIQSHSFFGSLLLKQKVVEVSDGSVTTLSTDGKHLYFNPQAVLDSSPAHLRTSCAHEALHPALLHHTRRGSRDPRQWNEACDYVVNLILRDAGFDMRPGALLRDDFAGMTAEQVYKALADERRSESESDDDDDDDGESESEGDDGESEGDQPGSDFGSLGDSENPLPDVGGMGCFIDAPQSSQDDRGIEENEWRVALTQGSSLQRRQHAGLAQASAGCIAEAEGAMARAASAIRE